jgi:hypothetical protein
MALDFEASKMLIFLSRSSPNNQSIDVSTASPENGDAVDVFILGNTLKQRRTSNVRGAV